MAPSDVPCSCATHLGDEGALQPVATGLIVASAPGLPAQGAGHANKGCQALCTKALGFLLLRQRKPADLMPQLNPTMKLLPVTLASEEPREAAASSCAPRRPACMRYQQGRPARKKAVRALRTTGHNGYDRDELLPQEQHQLRGSRAVRWCCVPHEHTHQRAPRQGAPLGRQA